VSLVSAATQDGARGLREGMERREAVVVVKVVSGDQNSLRGQIGLERVLRWSQARTGAVCRMRHKYRPGETTPGELGDNYVSRGEMQDGSSSSSGRARRGRGRRDRSEAHGSAEGRNAAAGTEQAE
jgi:hypothetical protein